MDLKVIAQNRYNYRNYLKGQRVVIVGPAPSILNSEQHDLIESYDVVVRLNRALPLPEKLKKDVGERTDVLYNCMNPSNECGGKIDIKVLKENGVKFLVSPYAPVQDEYRFKKDIEAYWKENGNAIPFCHVDHNHFKKLLQIMQLPNTGICAILDLLKQDIAELYITGFTFFKGGYVKEYRPYNEQQVLQRMARYNLHNQEKQLKYMKNILSKDKRVKMDSALDEIINSKKDVSFKIKSGSKNQVKTSLVKKEVTKGKKKINRKIYLTGIVSIKKL